MILVPLVLATIAPVLGQEIQENEPWVIMLEYEHGDLWEFDPLSGEKTLLFTYEITLGQILDFVVDPAAQAVYILEGPGCCGGLVAGESQVAQVDLSTGETEIIYSSRNAFDLELIPDSNHLLLSHYDPTLDSIRAAARDGLVEYCVLEPLTQTCSEESGIERYRSVQWLNNHQYIGNTQLTPSTGGKSFLVSMTDNAVDLVELPIFVGHSVLTPGGDHLLVSSDIGSGTLYLLDLATFRLSDYEMTGNDAPNALFYPLSFSPDGNYLVSVYQHSRLHQLINYRTHSVVARFENSSNVIWFSDDSLLYIYYPQLGNYPGHVVRYDIPTDETVTLFELDTAIAIEVVD